MTIFPMILAEPTTLLICQFVTVGGYSSVPNILNQLRSYELRQNVFFSTGSVNSFGDISPIWQNLKGLCHFRGF